MQPFHKYIIAFALIISSNLLLSQDPVREIININKSFYNDKDVSIEVTSKYFVDDLMKPKKESKTTIYKKQGSYLYKTDIFESMANKKYIINVNHAKKTIIVNSITNKSSNNKEMVAVEFEKSEFKTTLDTVLNYYKKVEIKSLNETSNEIVFSFKSGMYDYIKITYDKKSYLVYNYYMKLKATSNNSKDGKIHNYAYTLTNKYLNRNLLSKKLFSESNYVIIKDKEVKPAYLLNGYKVINNIKINN